MGNRVSRITDAISRRKRKETGQDPVEGCADLEDRFYNNDSFKRGAEADVSTSAAETPVEAPSRKDEDISEDVKAPAEEKVTEKVTDEITVDENDGDQEDAAIKIQAGYKGYKARKEVKELKTRKSQMSQLTDDTEGTNNAEVTRDAEGAKDAESTKDAEGSKDAESTKDAEGSNDTQGSKDTEEAGDAAGTNDATPKDDTKEQENPDEEVIDIDLNDPEVANAAAKIQAGFRGHQSRKEMAAVKQPAEQPKEDKEDKDANNSAIKEADAIDIDITDPEVSAAATKIQANFRGHQTRQKLKDTPKVTPSAADVHSEPIQKEEAKTKQEEIDIDLTDPEVEAAAQKIQASFRGHLKSKRKQTISQEESQEKETLTSGKDKVEKISSAISSSPIPSEGSGVQKEKEDENVTEGKVKEEVTDMKPTEQTVEKVNERGSGDGNKVNKNERKTTVASAEVKKQEVPVDMEATATPQATEVEEIDIDLNDPEVAAATKKLQAGFRGRLNRRKKAKENALTASTDPASEEAMSQKSDSATPVQDATGDQGQKDEKSINYEDPQVHLAATKVQAGFKGYQTRKSLKKQAGSSGDLEKDSGS